MDKYICGVYKLFFNKENFYIGCSINVYGRLRDHLSALKSVRHDNLKLQEAYNKYGVPTLEVLKECSANELYENEFKFIQGLNATSSLNRSIGGRGSLPGELHSQAIASNLQAQEIVFYLAEVPSLTHREIAEIVEVPVDIVHNIAKGATHTWLCEGDPVLYEKMMSLKGKKNGIHLTVESKGIYLPDILSPCGDRYKVTNIRAFSREHNLDYGSLNRLLHGEYKTVKGWKVFNESKY